MCFFLDACNDALLERWNEHSNTIADNKCKKIFTKQCENDRKQQDKAEDSVSALYAKLHISYCTLWYG